MNRNENIKIEAEKLFEIAEIAFCDGDLATARRVLLQAEEIYPTPYGKAFLSKIQDSAEETSKIDPENKRETQEYYGSTDDKWDDAMKCVNIAQNSLISGDIVKAKRLLLKAERLYPTEEAKSLLKVVDATRAQEPNNRNQTKSDDFSDIRRSTSNSFKSDDSQESTQRTDVSVVNKDEAEKCVEIAFKSMSDNNFEKAEKFLMKSIRLFPTGIADNLLKQIRNDELPKNDTGTLKSKTADEGSSSQSKNNDDNLIRNKEEAEIFLEAAERAIANENFDKAEKFILKSQRLFSSVRSKVLLDQLRIAKAWHDEFKSENTSEETTKKANPQPRKPLEKLELNKAEADKCIEIAQNAYSNGDLDKAKKFLVKAERLYSCTRVADLLKQVKAASENPDYKQKHSLKKETARAETKKKFDLEFGKGKPPKKINVEEQMAAIRRVKAAKNDYEIIGVPQGASIADARKAFRKLTLLLHPDKNKNPEAKEAFMIVNEAMDRLARKDKKDDQKPDGSPNDECHVQ